MDWVKLTIEYSIETILTHIMLACRERAKHYYPTYSVFDGYADALAQYIPQIIYTARKNYESVTKEVK
jgi:hypothetical protein